MERGDPSGQDQENNQKRRRSQSKFNKDLPRYECFCSKQYLSYPALYLHMKNKHNDYFQSSKSGKKVEPTKLIESYNHTEGYKVYKIAVDSSLIDPEKKDMFGGKYFQQSFLDNNKANLFMNGNYMGYSNLPFNYGYVMPENHNEDKKQPQREAFIEVALSMFMLTLNERPTKQRYETELFFHLYVDCLNRHYEKLKDTRTEGKEVHRYTAEYDSEKLLEMLPYFQEYLASITDEYQACKFFLKKSHIITSKQYKNVLEQFYNYVYSKKAKPALSIPIPPPASSDNQGHSDEVPDEEADPDEEEYEGQEDEENEQS